MKRVAQVRVRTLASLDSFSASRRLKHKSGWDSVFVGDEGEVVPSTVLGNHYVLNYAITEYNITPTNKAFRNLHLRGLVKEAGEDGSAVDKSRAVLVASSASPSPALVVGGEGGLPAASFGRLFATIREHLSESPTIFVHDGALGLTRGGPTVRSFVDSASRALLLHHLLRTFRLPLGEPEPENDKELQDWLATLPEDLRNDFDRVARMVRSGQLKAPPPRDPHDVTQFLVPRLQLTQAQAQEFGLPGPNFSVVDPVRRIVVHAGANATAAAVRGALLQVASGLWGTSQVVAAETLASTKRPDAGVLVFGSGVLDGAFASFQTIWNASGALTPVWQAVETPVSATNVAAFGDYVEQVGTGAKKALVVGRRRGPRDPFSLDAGPMAAVFIDPGKKQPAKVSVEQAKAYLQQYGTPAAEVEAMAEKFARLKVPLFAVESVSAKTVDSVVKN